MCVCVSCRPFFQKTIFFTFLFILRLEVNHRRLLAGKGNKKRFLESVLLHLSVTFFIIITITNIETSVSPTVLSFLRRIWFIFLPVSFRKRFFVVSVEKDNNALFFFFFRSPLAADFVEHHRNATPLLTNDENGLGGSRGIGKSIHQPVALHRESSGDYRSKFHFTTTLGMLIIVWRI